MRTPLRLAIAATIGVAAFAASTLGIEFGTWYWFSPSDPLADPDANAVRFAVAVAAGLGSALAVYPRTRRRRMSA